MLRGRFKGLSREFQGYFKEVKEVSGCFESFSRKFKECLICIKSLSKILMLLLLLYCIRRSFPSRRRACLGKLVRLG